MRPQILKESQVILGDLPIGYYPDDQIASRYQVASPNEHTYAHHLLMEQSLKYLEKDGFAILLAPNDLLTSPQSDLLKGWLQEQANIVAMIALPPNLFGKAAMAKSILSCKESCKIVGAVCLSLTKSSRTRSYSEVHAQFQNWKQENAI